MFWIIGMSGGINVPFLTEQMHKHIGVCETFIDNGQRVTHQTWIK